MKIWLIFLQILMCTPSYGGEALSIQNVGDFKLETWSHETITIEDGTSKIMALDAWFTKLTPTQKEKFVTDYITARNQLFLVVQEKRLAKEYRDLEVVDPVARTRATWIESSTAIIRKEKFQRLKAIQELNVKYLSDKNFLSQKMFENIDDVNGGRGGGDLAFSSGSLSSRSVSKSSVSDYSFDSISNGNLNLSGSDSIKQKSAREMKSVQELLKSREMRERRRLIDRKNSLCTTDSNIDPNNFFDTSKSPRENQFLNNLGITSWRPSSPKRDLSAWFGTPEYQGPTGRANAMCVGHAIANGMTAALARENGGRANILLSATQIYSVASIREEGHRKINIDNPNYCDLKSYSDVNPYAGVQSVENALKGLATAPACSVDGQSRKVVSKFESLIVRGPKSIPLGQKSNLNFDFFRILIDNGFPPIVHIDSDTRDEYEDWINIKSFGHMQHALTVVGYGEDLDPRNLCKTKYFIVRDSLGQKLVHYKVPAANLIAHLLGVYGVVKVEDAPEQGFFQKFWNSAK